MILAMLSKQGKAHDAEGKVLQQQRKYSQAIELYEQSRLIFLEIGENERARQVHFEQGDAYYAWGEDLRRQKNYSQAIELYEQSRLIFLEIGDEERAAKAQNQKIEARRNEADDHCNLGKVLQQQRKYSQAIEQYEQARKIFLEISENERARQVHSEQGDAYYAWGEDLRRQKNYSQAIERYKQALKIKAELKDRTGVNRIQFALILSHVQRIWLSSDKMLLSTGLSVVLLAVVLLVRLPSNSSSKQDQAELTPQAKSNAQPIPTPTLSPQPSPTSSPLVSQPKFQTSAPSGYRVVCPPSVNDGVLNVRQSPNILAEVVEQIPCDTVGVQITGDSVTSDDGKVWVPVQYQKQGWSVRRLLSEP